MRLLLGVLVLLALFSAAALWQRSWTKAARSSREPFPSSSQEPASAAGGDGWSRVVLGRPSGGEPYVKGTGVGSEGSSSGTLANPQEGLRDGRQEPVPRTDTPASDSRSPEKDVVVTVKAGQTLSEICHDHYGTAGLELVRSVARYNQLSGPDEIREGQGILLPALEKMEKQP